MKRKPALAMLAEKKSGPVDLNALASAAGFAEVIEGQPAAFHQDEPDGPIYVYVALTSCGIKEEGQEYPPPVPVNTRDAVERYKEAFMAWAKDQPVGATLLVRQWPVLQGWDNGKRAIYSRLAVRPPVEEKTTKKRKAA